MPRCAPASAAEARKAGETNLPGPDIVIEGASKWGAIQTAMDICANDGAVVVVARGLAHLRRDELLQVADRVILAVGGGRAVRGTRVEGVPRGPRTCT